MSKFPSSIVRPKAAKLRVSNTSHTSKKGRVKTNARSVPKHQSRNPRVLNLQDWYSSEEAKRKFGRICQAVNEESREIELGGSVDRPLLSLVDTSLVPTEKNEVEISIIEATADWSSVTAAALFYGTVFRIRGKRVVRAILRRHRINRHGAHKYWRREIEDMSQTLSTFIEDFERVSKRLDKTNDLIQKHFRERGHSQDQTVSEVTAAPTELCEAQMRGPLAQPPGPDREEQTNTRTTYITRLVGSEEKHPCAKYDDLKSAYADAKGSHRRR